MPLTIDERLSQSPATSAELQAATGLSQSGVSRKIRQMGDAIISLRRGRSRLYALSRNAFDSNHRLPLFMVDPHGNNVNVAWIRPLAHGGFFVEADTGMPSVLLGEGKDGLFDDLPYFLDDLRPQGFLGRQIAQELSSLTGAFPSDPTFWNTNQVGRYLVSNGDDLPGNFKFGQQAHLRVRRKPVPVTESDYPRLATTVLEGGIPDSSAGGEQPKFTAYNQDRGHVIVKFSSANDDAVSRRWRDILITEHHAAETLHKYEIPAAETSLFERDGRLFLESQRFDRSGEYGRMPMISLQAVDAEFCGIGNNWPGVMDALAAQDRVNPYHVVDAQRLWCFGRLINNTDMHLGNLSLSIEGGVFRILPAYDMCSMGFAPRSSEIRPYAFSPPGLKGSGLPLAAQKKVVNAAHDFWHSVTQDPRISSELRSFLSHGNPLDGPAS